MPHSNTLSTLSDNGSALTAQASSKVKAVWLSTMLARYASDPVILDDPEARNHSSSLNELTQQAWQHTQSTLNSARFVKAAVLEKAPALPNFPTPTLPKFGKASSSAPSSSSSWQEWEIVDDSGAQPPQEATSQPEPSKPEQSVVISEPPSKGAEEPVDDLFGLISSAPVEAAPPAVATSTTELIATSSIEETKKLKKSKKKSKKLTQDPPPEPTTTTTTTTTTKVAEPPKMSSLQAFFVGAPTHQDKFDEMLHGF